MQWKVSGYDSEYTLFQDWWIVEASTAQEAIEQVARSFARHYPDHVVEFARKELQAKPLTQPTGDKETQ